MVSPLARSKEVEPLYNSPAFSLVAVSPRKWKSKHGTYGEGKKGAEKREEEENIRANNPISFAALVLWPPDESVIGRTGRLYFVSGRIRSNQNIASPLHTNKSIAGRSTANKLNALFLANFSPNRFAPLGACTIPYEYTWPESSWLSGRMGGLGYVCVYT